MAACTGDSQSNDAKFTDLANEVLQDTFQRYPTWATALGIHAYDEKLEDYSRQAVADALRVTRTFRDRIDAIPENTLSLGNQLDRAQLLHALESRILTLDVVREWQKDPDVYASGIAHTAYLMIKRSFATPEERLKRLIAREKLMIGVLAEARRNIENPPRIYVEIALEQIDSNRDLFKDAVTEAFQHARLQFLVLVSVRQVAQEFFGYLCFKRLVVNRSGDCNWANCTGRYNYRIAVHAEGRAGIR